MQLQSPYGVGNGARIHSGRHYRHPLWTVAYVRIDHANGGIIRNLSDSGMAIQAVGRLHPEQVVHLRFELIRPRAKFEIVGQVIWADSKGQAGLRFTDIAPRTRRLLKDWMLTDLLAATMELTASPVLTRDAAESGLVMSNSPVRAIQLLSDAEDISIPVELGAAASKKAGGVSVPWWPGSFRQRTLARFVDGIMVLSAVLLFSIIAVELTDAFPSWPVLVGTGAALALAFALLYWYLCQFVLGCSLGARLGRLAAEDVPSLDES